MLIHVVCRIGYKLNFHFLHVMSHFLRSHHIYTHRALDKFSECQDNIMSFHVQKWPDISNGWSDIPSKKEAKKKERKKKWEKNDGTKNRKKRN